MKNQTKPASRRARQPGVLSALVLVIFLLGLSVPMGRAVQADAPVQPLTGPAWYDGLIQYSQITNCVSIIQGYPYIENGVGTFVGFLADPDNAVPYPNQTYYLHVYIAGLGNSCSGMRAYLDIALPASTSLAIIGTDKVTCLFDGVPIAPATDCPQTLPASPYNPGAYAIYSTDTAHAYTWPVPQGHTLEFQIPVKSSTALTNSVFRANVWMLDGNSSPWLYPQQGVYVFSASPSILYPSPSTINITATGARSEAYLYTHGLGGTGYFDLGTSAAYGLVHEPVAITAGGNAFLAWDEWGPPALTPDTLYHWRFTFTDSNGQSYFGADQTFHTLPDGRVTVGSGASAGCTEAALTTALPGAKEIVFDCGVLPVTITLTSPKTISANLVIDGGNKVTLDGGGGASFFNVQSGAHLTLKKITLSNGFNALGCGGAVNVPAGAQLSVDEARFIHNQANYQGGAICNSGTADVTGTFFKDNATLASHGGAIGNYGTLTITNSTFTGNSAAINGGGIDTTSVLTVANTVFNANTAGFRGGAINNYLGTLTVTGNTLTGNTAGYYGGGLANDGGTLTLQSSRVSGNTAAAWGGGVRNTGTLVAQDNELAGNNAADGGGLQNSGTATLVNNTMSANHASSNGGGLFVDGGQVSLVNNTFYANTASGQGGNLYAGATYNGNVSLKNTILAAGAPNNCTAGVLSNGNNLEGGNSCGLAAGGDLANTGPMLGLLDYNGGPTRNHSLMPGSPAIDHGNNTGCPAADQRGVARPLDGDKAGAAVCDIGAYEFDPTAPLLVFLPLVRR